MEKKMEFYNFKQREEDKHSLSVDEYKEKFLRLHKYAPEVTGNALKSKLIEGLREELKYQVKGSGCTDFLDAVAKAENFEKMEEFTMKKAASARNRVIARGHRPQGSTVPSSRFNSNQTWVNYGQRNNNNNNQRIANNNQRPNTQVNGGQNDNQKKRQPVRWQQNSEFLERARRLGLCFRCGEQGHRTFECPNKAITAPMQAKVTELDATIEEASEEEQNRSNMQGLKARIKELEELNHRLLAKLRGKQVEGASGSAGTGGSGGAGEDVVGGAGTGGEGIGGKGTKRRRERDEEDAGESALKRVFKKAKLNKFNGEKKTGEDLEAWIEELEDFFALREFSEEAKAKVAIVQLRSVAKLWWKSYMQTRSRVGPVLWEEFREQAEKRYCSPHYNMEKKMKIHNFKQREEDKHSLSVDEYKEKFLRLHKYALEVTGNALKSKLIEGLREELKYQVEGSGCTDFLDAVAKAENFEKMEEFTMKKAASARNIVIATGHRPQGSTVPSSRFNSNQTWVNYGQRNNNNNNQRIANNNQRPNTQVNGGQNDNQKKRQPVRWQQDSKFLERARRLGLCFRCGEQGHRTFECPNKAITAPMQAKVTELDATIEEASEEEQNRSNMQGLKARIKELEELNHRLLAELRGKQVEGASGSAGAGGSGGAGEDVVGGAGTGGEGIGGKGTKRRRERDEEDAGESALKRVFKKAKLNEFNGEKKTGEDLEAWIEELEDFFALREFFEEAKAKVAIVQLRSVAKLWWKSYMQTRSRVGPVLWEEFREQAEKRYCSPHYNMEKKMEFYNFKQREEDKHSLSVDEYKEKFLRLHKYAPEVTGNALKSKLIEGLREELKYQVKGSGCTDFLDAVAKAENFEKMEEFTMKKAASARNRVIATGHRPQGSTVPSSRFNSNQTWVNYGQRNNNNNNQRIANNNQRPNTQVNGGQNDNQKKRQPVRWQQDSKFLERARRLGLCFRCGEQGHRTFECPNKAITAPMQAKVTELDATIEEASEEEQNRSNMQGLKARIKELEELNHRLLAELRGKQVEGASGSAGAGGSGGAGEDVVGGAGTGGEGIGGKGTKRRRERDEEDAGESALKRVFKKAKLNEFNGEKKTGEDLEAWIEELEDFFALREFFEEAKAKVAIVQLRSVAKLWWKSYMQTRSRVGPVLWEEFREQAEKRYCSPHYNMEKKMEFYNFKQREEDKHSLSVDEYKEKFLRLHKYAPEVTGNALKSKLIEGLREELKYQVKGSGCTDFLDAVAKAENFEKMEEFTMKKAASARNRVIARGHRPQGSTVPSSRFNSNQTWVNYGQHNNNNNNLRIANNNQRPNTQVNGGQNDNQKKRQPVRWQQNSEFLERARRLGLCFRCGEQGHRTFECPNKAITAPMQAKVTELDATIEEASEKEQNRSNMQGLKARIKELEELNHRLLAELRGKQVEGASGSAGTGGSGGAGEDVVGGAGTGGEGIGGKGTKRRRERDEEDAGESALKRVFKKAKLNEFNGEKKTGEDLEAWIEELEDFFALREFSEEAKAKVAIVQLRSVAKLWWKSYMQTRSRVGPVL
ncbi:hypothetical protein L7F22_051736 [Adiantum nelumboides]|nr:hypothetical protein [Adiantum nelumboides]